MLTTASERLSPPGRPRVRADQRHTSKIAFSFSECFVLRDGMGSLFSCSSVIILLKSVTDSPGRYFTSLCELKYLSNQVYCQGNDGRSRTSWPSARANRSWNSSLLPITLPSPNHCRRKIKKKH